MEKLDYLHIKCKEPGCPHEILFTGEVKVPGNYDCAFISNIKNEALLINILITPMAYEPNRLFEESITTIFKIYQEKTNYLKELVYEKRKKQPVKHIDKFYLTCEAGHTHPYEIITKI